MRILFSSFFYVSCLLVTLFLPSVSYAIDEWKVISAFEHEGKFLIQVMPSHPNTKNEFQNGSERMATGRVFYGDPTTGLTALSYVQTIYDKRSRQLFYDPRIGVDAFGLPRLSINYQEFDFLTNPGTEIDVQCGDTKTTYRSLAKGEFEKLQSMFQKNQVSLKEAYREYKPWKLFKITDEGQYVYLERSTPPGYSRAFIGKPGQMKESPVIKLEGYLDGGSLDVKLQNGSTLALSKNPKKSFYKMNGVSRAMEQMNITDDFIADLKLPVSDQKISQSMTTPCDSLFDQSSDKLGGEVNQSGRDSVKELGPESLKKKFTSPRNSSKQ